MNNGTFFRFNELMKNGGMGMPIGGNLWGAAPQKSTATKASKGGKSAILPARMNQATRSAPPGSATVQIPVREKPRSAANNPDYSNFSSLYGEWSKRHGRLPRYVPKRVWQTMAPDYAHLDSAALDGAYDRITFHHTGSMNTPQAVNDFDRGREDPIHFAARNWRNGGHAQKHHDADITYHFLIAEDGTIYEGRSLAFQGAHVWGQNPKNIGIAFLGDYSSRPLSKAQERSARILVHALNDVYGIYKNAGGKPYIFTHRDLAPPEGEHARPKELKGAQPQMDSLKAWSITTLPPPPPPPPSPSPPLSSPAPVPKPRHPFAL